MVGVNRILRGNTVPCPVGNSALPEDQELESRRKYVSRALDILQKEVDGPRVFTLDSEE